LVHAPKGAEALCAPNEIPLNNIAARVSTSDLKNFCHVENPARKCKNGKETSGIPLFRQNWKIIRSLYQRACRRRQQRAMNLPVFKCLNAQALGHDSVKPVAERR
jgi:hypothetical protein